MPITPPPGLSTILSPKHRQLWGEADAFAADIVASRIARMEANPSKVERGIFKAMADAGWFGVTIPARFGGMAAGHVAKSVLIHRMSVVSGAAGAGLQASLIPTGALDMWGTLEQRQLWLPQAAAGSRLFSIAVTEPEAGGHIGGIETVAERDGDWWVISGEKAHIGNSHLAGLHIVVARTAPPGVRASRALTAFLVEDDRRGVTKAPHEAGLGMHGFTAGVLRLHRVRIPDGNVLGEVGRGMDVAQSASILYGRANLAAVSLGLHEAFVTTTARWLKQRPRYEGSLSDLPVLRYRLGAMQARLQAAQTAAYHAVHLLDQGLSCDMELIGAKHTSHESAAQSARDAMEIHGAHALAGSNPIQRYFRDVQYTYPPAGTSEFQRMQLAKVPLDEVVYSWSEWLAAKNAWAPDRAPA